MTLEDKPQLPLSSEDLKQLKEKYDIRRDPFIAIELATAIEHYPAVARESNLFHEDLETLKASLYHKAFEELTLMANEKKCWHAASWIAMYYRLGISPANYSMEQYNLWEKRSSEWCGLDYECGGIHTRQPEIAD